MVERHSWLEEYRLVRAAPIVPPEVETNRRVTPLLRIDHMVSTACETSNVSHRMLYLHDARRHLDHHMAVTKRNAENTPMIRSIEEKLSRAMAETIAMEQSAAENLMN
ncbi:unnamed protein product [Bursaphelenchus xylophilus]|uniref:(pine wood nematode) hypothetical protein n=1 Tax=Bursaphelenchus xylophilus TaxID=6326 RepID=A0A7I8X7E3_BURXY|nr:unnamed protein product [Bursaphelenchus xylophilus]CAG9126182.1 unnamed protein product [Bursaphelenchus xylophilus]